MTDHTVSRTSDGRVRKQYRPNPGDAPVREWQALQLLHDHARGLAPEPLEADLHADPPYIMMSALPGTPLGGKPLSAADLRAMAVALDDLHSCVPQQVLDHVPAGTGWDAARARIREQLAEQPRPTDDSVVSLAYDEALRWLSGPEATRVLSEDPGRAVLGRSDHNLTNFLRDGDRVYLVDFEYAGRTDRCAEFGELLEHISARCTPDATWQQFLDGQEWSPAEHRRLLAIRRLLAAMWLRMLMPGQEGERRNPPGTLGKQARRMLGLLNS
ncbi:MAG TPA: hypothetical protein VHC49_21580 [Mycobacteriales bacterium]|nr:hypothetical protein [Mycobacteriales bacterium]